MNNIYIDFKITELLDSLNIKYRRADKNNVKIRCINPEHNDSSPSMHIHTDIGGLHCFACGFSGSIYTLIQHETGITNFDSLLYASKFAVTKENSDRLAQIANSRLNKEEEKKEFKYPKHRKIDSHWYLEKRRFTFNEIKDWNMGIVNDPDPDYIRYNGWVYIPIFQNKEQINYFLRNPFGNDKVYGPYPKNHILAGWDNITHFDSVYITEGIFKTIAVNRTGEQSLASLGNMLSEQQLLLLKKFKEVNIIPDNDMPGLRLVQTVLPLMYSCDINICELPLGKKDADECTTEELKLSIKNKVKLQDFIVKSL